MAAIGGSIQEITIADRSFAVASDADVNRDFGGFTNNIESNGDGSVRVVKKRRPWKVENLSINIDDELDAQEYLQDICDKGDLVPITVTTQGDNIYSGMGTIIDEVSCNLGNTTASISLSGENRLTKL